MTVVFLPMNVVFLPSPECEAWTFRAEPSLECRLFATDARTCDISYFPSGLDPDDCGQAGTSTTTTAPTTTDAPTTTAIAGKGNFAVINISY